MPKSFFTYEKQIALLKTKGLSIPDEAYAKDILSRIGYYPLICGYKHPFKNNTTKDYSDGVSFDDIVALYTFDANLRNLFLSQLLKVERAIKSQLAYCFCDQYGEAQSAYLLAQNYVGNSHAVQKLVGILHKLATQSTDYPYINHHQTKYHNVPLWVLINAVTFGNLSKMFDLLPQRLQSQICRNYPLIIPQMKRILSVLTKYRNACAHGERLFFYKTRDDIPDFGLHAKLGIPKKGSHYINGKHDLFAVVISLRFLLPPKEFTAFKKMLAKLIDTFTTECKTLAESKLLDEMGFPANWKTVTRYKVV